MSNFYPEVHYSNVVQDILSEVPPFRKEPEFPSRPQNDGSCFLSMLMISGIALFIGGSVVTLDSNWRELEFLDGPVYIFAGILCVVVSLLIHKVSEEIQEMRFRRSPKFKIYNEKLKQWEYERAHEMTAEKCRDFRKSRFDSLAEFQISNYFSMREQDDIKIGVAEPFFLMRLSQRGLPIYGPLQLNLWGYSYYPDIVVSDPAKKILFDIEIDEPYTLDDKLPIHYMDSCGYSSDCDRNDAFTSHGFCVVRFSEEQIVKYTDECIDYLYQIINSISSGYDEIPKPPQKIICRRWTDEESKKMADEDYRMSYLPKLPTVEEITDDIFDNDPSLFEPEDDYVDDLPF